MSGRGKRVAIWLGSSAAVLLAVSAVFLRDQAWAWYLAYHFRQIGVVVVHDGDRVQCLTREGKVIWALTGLNPRGEVGAQQGLALDPGRSRIYVQDKVRRKIRALDSRGSELFTIDDPGAVALAVDPKTGEIWCLYDEDSNLNGETAVYDSSGIRMATHLFGGCAISHNRYDGTFWIAGKEILKVDRKGYEHAKGPARPGWLWFSVAPHHPDGSVWVLGRPGTLSATNVVLQLDRDGKLLREVQGFAGPTSVACDPKIGIAWVACPESSVERIPVEGKPLPRFHFPARFITFSERTGTAWLTTDDKIMAVSPTGEVLAEHELGAIHTIVWVAAP